MQSGLSEVQDNSKDIVAYNAAFLSAIEIGIGSVVHTLKIPLAGHILCLNQGFFLMRSSLNLKTSKEHRFLPTQISNIVALLKALSPSGRRLTIMVAICGQGLLFNFGTLLLGVNPFGFLFGMTLLSLFGFVWQFILYYFLYGHTLIEMAQFYFSRLLDWLAWQPTDLILFLAAVLGVKVVLGWFLIGAAYLLPETWIQKYQLKLLSSGRKRRKKLETVRMSEGSPVLGALKDLMNPLFLFSLLLTATFFVASKSEMKDLFLFLLRPVALGFILFYALRAVSFEPLLKRLEDWNFTRFSHSFRRALTLLRAI